MSTTFADQEQRNKLLVNDMQSKLAAVTLNSSRSLGDVKRDKAVEMTHAHTESVVHALGNLSWSEWATGQYGLPDLHQQLSLEIPLAELTQAGHKPRYDELLKLIDTLDALIADPGLYGPYRTVISTTRARLDAERDKFRNSSVDIDQLDHAPLTRLIDVLKQCVLASVESLVERMDKQQTDLEAQWGATVTKYLDVYSSEATMVEAASAARLRAARREDEMDPWQAPAEDREPVFDSDVARRWHEREKRSQVAQEYDSEWYEKHRDEVATLLPRARRVAAEMGQAEFFDPILDIVTNIFHVATERVQTIVEREEQNRREAQTIVGNIQKEREGIVAAGASYQEKKRQQREASERDLAKVVDFRARQQHGSAELTHEFETAKGQAVTWLEENERDIEDKMKQLIALQESIVQLTQSRRQVVDGIVAASEAESKRLSRQRAFVSLCDQYDAILRKSMQDFLLPAGYSAVLVDFAADCERLAQSGFDAQAQSLSALLTTAMDKLERSATVQLGVVPPLIFRKTLKREDLLDKAHLARLQREFCASTNDPYRARHETTERDILALDAAIASELPPLEARQAAIVDAVHQLNDRFFARNNRPPLSTVDIAARFAEFMIHPSAEHIKRMSRVPIVAPVIAPLRTGQEQQAAAAQATLVDITMAIPPKYYDPGLVGRAVQAATVERVFK